MLSDVPKADQQCSAVRDPGSRAEELRRVPWIHIKYVKSSSHRAVESCSQRNSSWVAAHHTPEDRDGWSAEQLSTARLLLRDLVAEVGADFSGLYCSGSEAYQGHTPLARAELATKFCFCKLF